MEILEILSKLAEKIFLEKVTGSNLIVDKKKITMLNPIAGNLDNLYSSLELLKKVVIIASNLDSSLELLIPRATRRVG